MTLFNFYNILFLKRIGYIIVFCYKFINNNTFSIIFMGVNIMTVAQAIKKYKLEPVNEYTSQTKAKELNVEAVLYMNVQKNKYAYIVKDGARGYVLYQDEKSLSTKLYKGLKMTPLQP